MILFGPGSLYRAVTEYAEHYHRERNHQGLGNELIRPAGTPHSTTGPAQCRERLGGLLRFYHRDAG